MPPRLFTRWAYRLSFHHHGGVDHVAVAFDHFGWFHMPVHAISPGRIAGPFSPCRRYLADCEILERTTENERDGFLLHFGDLHIDCRNEQNYADFLTLIEEANRHLTSSIDFAFLPGDNADNGAAEEYELIREALDRFALPVHAITGITTAPTTHCDCFNNS